MLDWLKVKQASLLTFPFRPFRATLLSSVAIIVALLPL